jgi:putative peptide maturation dehydrogenase
VRVRRCAILTLEPRERLAFTLAGLAGGGSGLRAVVEWFALAPHVAAEIMVSDAEAAALGKLSPSRWVEDDAPGIERDLLATLIEKELVVAEGSAAAARDERVREAHWHGASATMHYASRWRNVDTEAAEREYAEVLQDDFLPRLGSAPPPVRERTQADRRLALPAPAASALDALLDRRVTCRNFSRARALTQAEFSAVLYRTYGARTVDDFAPGVTLLKKGVPSAGGLHATEAYLLVQRVDGIAPGLYHYHPVDHALEPIRALDASAAAALARRFVAAQGYFADAHVLVVPASRFRRNFWKYRNHAKAYRALILDVGHLSQTMYLAATELGLAAFVTAAVNEADIEEAFGLDPLEEGPLAVTGFGIRAAERNEVEFDPLHAVWRDE